MSCANIIFAAEPLTVKQIEKVAGTAGMVAKPGRYDTGSLRYYTSKNDLVLTIKVASASTYEVWKSQPSATDQVPVSGLGEDAVSSKEGHYVCFKKAGTGVCILGMELAAPVLIGDAQILELV
jgi:hypothetical protein